MQPTDIRDYSALPWIHEAFHAAVRDHADAVALRVDDTSVTYRELGARVRWLTDRLREHEVRPGDVVGIALERSADLVAALLATLTAGAAYLPLDPDYPEDRVRFMLQDSGARLVLARRRSADRVSGAGADVLSVDGAGQNPAVRAYEHVRTPVTAASLAYVIYTSGSTGRPKGVMVTHAGLRNRLAWMQERYGLDPADRVLQKTPSSFDVSVWEFFWPLTQGACLVLARPGGHWELDYLAGLIRSERVTVAHFVPSVLRLFLAEPGAAGCTTLRHMFCSGEALTPDLADTVLRTLPCRLHNLYGPTEAAVDVTWWHCRPGDDTVPIGHPCPNTTVRLLTPQGAPAPAATPGEICIGGVQVAAGYLNRPALTAERFVPDPLATEPGARLYRTGDLGTRRADGAIDFHGRMDQQVKLYGNRIEIGEIEACLSEHPAVQTAVVSVTGEPDAPALAARVVPAPGRRPRPADLTAHLRSRLPVHMVPQRIETVEWIPLTPSGKIDRLRLDGDAPRNTARVVDKVAARARTTPDAVAVSMPGGTLSHGELQRRTALLADRLRTAAPVAGGTVAVVMPDPVDRLLAVLAAHRAGAAAALLPDALPAEERRPLLADAGAVALVTAGPAPGAEPSVTPLQAPPDAPPAPADLAVVRYETRLDRTPYGVQTGHGSLLATLDAMRGRLSWQDADEVLLVIPSAELTSLGLELLLPLVTGGRVAVAAPAAGRDPAVLAEAVLGTGATTVWAGHATWRSLLDAGWSGDPALRLVGAGSTPPPELARRLIACGRAVWSVDGYAEATDWSHALRLSGREPAGTLGRPLQGTVHHLLTPEGRPVDPGTPTGRLAVGGRGLGLGYRNRPDLTAGHFGSAGGGRCFLTGRLMTRRPGGLLEPARPQEGGVPAGRGRPAGAAKPRWLLRRPDPAAEARLFCFPYSGCGASMYHRWPRRIGGLDICFVQPPARENRIREPHYGSYEQLAADLVAFLPPYLDKPYGLFGHCGGALAAAELAHQLDRAGLPAPVRLFASAQVAPHDGPYGRFLDLGPEELSAELRAIVLALGGQPSPKLIAQGTQLLGRDLEAARRYRVPEPRKLPCAVTAVGWTDDPEVPADRMGGWREIAADCREVLLDGGHYTFLGAPPQLLAEFERGMRREPPTPLREERR
ncbi:amino acid adenylation domain-containing protein [Streptomyces hyaluromycini]|uniref:Amino acid adenylation domain-containing protein n=1 Tax=Streptomyces hyaluromycini TaxID=1377993 RepID=A0ABV1XBH5_9ACTN